MKQIFTILIFAFSINALCKSQSLNKVDKVVTNEPIYYLDEIRISSEEVQNLNPNDLAAIEVFKDSTAIKNLGNEGKNGVIYINHKICPRKIYGILKIKI